MQQLHVNRRGEESAILTSSYYGRCSYQLCIRPLDFHPLLILLRILQTYSINLVYLLKLSQSIASRLTTHRPSVQEVASVEDALHRIEYE